MEQNDADSEVALRGYGDAVDLAVRAPTLAGVIVALLLSASGGPVVTFDADNMFDHRAHSEPPRRLLGRPAGPLPILDEHHREHRHAWRSASETMSAADLAIVLGATIGGAVVLLHRGLRACWAKSPWIPTLGCCVDSRGSMAPSHSGIACSARKGPSSSSRPRCAAPCSSASLHCWRASWTDHPGPSNLSSYAVCPIDNSQTRKPAATEAPYGDAMIQAELMGGHHRMERRGSWSAGYVVVLPGAVTFIVDCFLPYRESPSRPRRPSLLPAVHTSEGIGSTQSVGGFSSCSEG